ncbi:hypothetical protein LINPERPRIM_LOCUS981 [Linum perenne]
MNKFMPALITSRGVSWLASQIGQPINKFIRDSLDVKVCVIKDISEAILSSIEVMMSSE